MCPHTCTCARARTRTHTQSCKHMLRYCLSEHNVNQVRWSAGENYVELNIYQQGCIWQLSKEIQATKYMN